MGRPNVNWGCVRDFQCYSTRISYLIPQPWQIQRLFWNICWVSSPPMRKIGRVYDDWRNKNGNVLRFESVARWWVRTPVDLSSVKNIFLFLYLERKFLGGNGVTWGVCSRVKLPRVTPVMASLSHQVSVGKKWPRVGNASRLQRRQRSSVSRLPVTSSTGRVRRRGGGGRALGTVSFPGLDKILFKVFNF